MLFIPDGLKGEKNNDKKIIRWKLQGNSLWSP